MDGQLRFPSSTFKKCQAHSRGKGNKYSINPKNPGYPSLERRETHKLANLRHRRLRRRFSVILRFIMIKGGEDDDDGACTFAGMVKAKAQSTEEGSEERQSPSKTRRKCP